MAAHADEVENRKKAALAAIRNAFGTEEDEFGATMFVSHHLEEIEASYWQQHLGAAQPEPIRVLDILELHAHWGDEDDDGLQVFDFTLPGNVTDYVISVRFDDDGGVEEILMES